jgi:16S rRNA (adenine(1408)-N(1))-methyltransferase
MIAITGKDKVNIDGDAFAGKVVNYKKIILDLGTGDGRFVFKNALKNPNIFFVGMDPAEKQLSEYSSKVNRKRMDNCMFVLGSIEDTPTELNSSFDEIYINLPWGSLLEKIVKINKIGIESIKNLLKENGRVFITLGYAPDLEPSETRRLDLPKIDEFFIQDQILPILRKNFSTVSLKKLSKKELGEIETTWAKKLKFGKDREIFRIEIGS